MFTFRKNGHFYERIGKKGEPICIDDEIQFDVPDTWEVCRLENLCSLLNPKIEEKSKYPYLNAKFLRNKIDPEIKEKGRFVEKNTKVILVDGENSGEVFLTHTDGYMGSTFRILYINSEMYDEYVLKLLELWKNPLKKSKKGAAIPHLNKDIFNKILVGIPPINEQKRIIDEINHIYPLIKEYDFNKEKLDKLNSEFPNKLRSSILQEAIQGKLVPQNPNDEPASILLEKIREEKKRLIKEKKIKRNKNESYIFKENNHFYEKRGNNKPEYIDNEILFDIPESWCWVRLNTLGLIIGGGTPKTKVDEYWINGKIPWLTPADMKFINDKYVSHGQRNITELGLEKSSAKLIPKNSIIYSSRAPIGYIGISKNELCTNQGFKSLVPFDEEIVNYIYYSLIALTPEIQSKASGTTFKEISGTKFGEILIPLPPINEQNNIIEKIEEIFSYLKL